MREGLWTDNGIRSIRKYGLEIVAAAVVDHGGCVRGYVHVERWLQLKQPAGVSIYY